MMRLIKTLALWACATWCAAHCSCSSSPSQVTGGGSSETVIGFVVDSQGQPVRGAAARLRDADYVATLQSADMLAAGMDGLTDDNGQFVLSTGTVGSGACRIEINDGTGAALMDLRLTGTDTIRLDTDTIRPYATFSGSVDSLAMGYVQLFGLERVAPVNAGRFTIADLPAATMRVRVVGADQLTALVEASNVRLTAGALTSATFDTRWRYSRRIYINTASAAIAQDITGFALLVRLSASQFPFDKSLSRGRDVRFVKTDNSPLSHELETWDSAGANAALWVKMDTVYAASTTQAIVMVWGPQIQLPADTLRVFDTANGYLGVWHMGDTGSSIRASSTGMFHARSANYDSDEAVPGVIGRGDELDGNDHDTLGMIHAQHVTLSLWINITRPSGWARVLYKQNSYHVLTDTLTPARVYGGVWVNPAADSGKDVLSGRTQVAPGAWRFVALSFDGDTVRFYVDGTVRGALSVPGTLNESGAPTFLAHYPGSMAPMIRLSARSMKCVSTESREAVRGSGFRTRHREPTVRYCHSNSVGTVRGTYTIPGAYRHSATLIPVMLRSAVTQSQQGGRHAHACAWYGACCLFFRIGGNALSCRGRRIGR